MKTRSQTKQENASSQTEVPRSKRPLPPAKAPAAPKPGRGRPRKGSPKAFPHEDIAKPTMTASKALCIPEILEQILSELPPFDIIRLQRVNKTWQTLITSSPLLQYKAWLRNDCPEPAHRIQTNDFLPKIKTRSHFPEHIEAEADPERKRYITNVSRHLHPIIATNIMKTLPRHYYFHPNNRSFSFRPVLLRDLLKWYEDNKDSEEKWGHQSLYRPPTHKIDWDVPSTDGSSLPFPLEAVPSDSDARDGSFRRNDALVHKAPDERLILTLNDLFSRLEWLWNEWLDWEREIHYLSHDGAGCDFDEGFPDHCLDRVDGDDGVGDSDSEDDESDGKETFGCRMSREAHVDACVRNASR